MGPWPLPSLVFSIALCTACANPNTPASAPSGVVAAPSSPAKEESRATPSAPEGPVRMAITVDDLPVHGPLPEGTTRLQVHRAILAALVAHDVPQVYGFANTASLADDPELEQSLRAWVDAGYPLGNHSFRHRHLREIGVEAYLADIDDNEPALARLSAPDDDWHVYRYPFLEEGDDPTTATTVRAHLDAQGYRVAEVTVDFYDWAFNEPYARCLATGSDAGIEALRSTYLSHAKFTLAWADDAAHRLLGRRIPHVLLLHAGAFDAQMLDALLTQYEEMGVEFISLDEALADPIYEVFEVTQYGAGGTLLEHLIGARNAPHPPWFTHPYPLLDALCR